MIKRVATPVVLAVAGSVLISILFHLSGGSINNDGVLYLRVADAFRDHGLKAALSLYGWPFYSLLIGWLSQLGLSLINAAWLINLLMFALLSGCFVALTKQLWPGQLQVHWSAAAVVLLLPELAELRSELLRDNAAFAMLLLSLWLLLRFIARRNAGSLLLWCGAVVLATLFRIELALLLPAGAIGFLFIDGLRRHGAGLLLLALLLGAVSLWGLQQYAPESRVRDLLGWAAFYAGEAGAKLADGAARLEAAVLNEYSRNYAREAMVAVLLVLLIGKLLKGLTPIHLAFLWAARRDAPSLQREQRIVWLGYFIALLLPPVLFMFQHFFLTQRYVFGVILLLLLLVPAAICTVLARVANPRLRAALGLALLLLFAGATARKAPGMDEHQLAGEWLQARPGSVWTNSSKIGFLAAPEFEGRQVTVDWQAGWSDRLPAAGTVAWLILVVGDTEREQLAPQLAAQGWQQRALFQEDRKSAVVWAAPTAAQ